MSFSEWSNNKKKKKNTSFSEWSNEKYGVTGAEKNSALEWRSDEIAPVQNTNYSSILKEAEKLETAAGKSRIGLYSKKGRPYLEQNEKVKAADEALTTYLKQYGFENMNELREAVNGTDEDDRTWFQSGAFSDGYQFGDVVKSIVGTVADVNENITEAVFDATENLIDTTAYGIGLVGGLFDDDFQDDVGDFIAKEILTPKESGEAVATYGNPIGWANLLVNGGETEENSLLGDKSDGLVQSGAHLVGSYALQYLGVPAWLTQGVNAFGSEIESAFQQGATFSEAGISGGISAAAEIVFERISSGIKFKGGTLDDGLQNWLKKAITNKVGRTVTKYAVDVAGEGTEEVLTEAASAVGRKMTYLDDKEWDEILSSEDMFDAFIGGAVMGGVAGGGKIVNSAKTGRDYLTGLTDAEEKVVNKLHEDVIAEKEKNGTKLTTRQKNELYDSIVEKMDKGDIDIDTIEEVLGGSTYEEYKSITEREKALIDEISQLENTPNEQITVKQKERLLEAREELKNITNKTELKTKLSDEVYGIAKNSRLVESYNEKARKSQAFEVDLGKPIALSDGEVAIVKRLPNKDMYNELYRRYPNKIGGVEDVKQLNSDVNYNMKELLSTSKLKKANVPDINNRHAKQGIIDFDTRTVKFYDGQKAYTIDFAIGNLQDGSKVAYAKKFYGYDEELTKKIQTAEGRRSENTPFNQQSVSKDILTENPNDVKTNFSVSADSQGNDLSLAVQKRFASSKAVDEDGNLKVLYHGTYGGEFYTFDKSKGSVEGDFGSGFYFTDSESDVTRNYEGGGPDFENKIDRRAEQIESEEEIDYIKARKKAIKELYKGSNKHTVYLNIENPAIVGETYLFEYDSFAEEYDREDYDSDEDYESDVEELIADKIDQIIWDIDRNVDIYSTDGIAEVLWNAVNEGGIDIERLKANINELYLEDNNGNLVGNEVTRQIIESLGYDGIIDNTVSTKFKGMNLNEDTTHYIVFKPNQIKSIDNQNPTDNPDIRYSLSEEASTKREPIISKLTNREISEQTYATLDKLQSGESVALEELDSLPEVEEGKEKVREYTAKFLESHPEFKNVPERELGTHLIDSAEREQLRNDILQDRLKSGSFTKLDKDGNEVYNGSVEKGKRLDIVIGLPAAGKSTSIVLPLSQYYKSVVVDSDIIKQELPEFNEGWGASLVHEESSNINAELFDRFTQTGANIVLPIVGAKTSSVENYINLAKAQGYDVHLHLNELNSSKAMGRMLRRYFSDGRFIPPAVSYKYGDKPTAVYEEFKNRSDLSGYSHWNNDVPKGQRPTLTGVSESNRALAAFSGTWRASRATDTESGTGESTQGESQSNQIAPIKETSSVDGVFFDGKNNSLSYEGEQPSTVGTPLNETALAPMREDVSTPAETKLADDIAPITEEEANALQDELFNSITDADAPPEVETVYDSIPDTTAINDKALNNIGKTLRDTLSLTPQETKAIQEIVQEYSTTETPNEDDLFNAIKEKFGEKVWKEKNQDLAEVKRFLRTTKVNVSAKIKSDIADYKDFRKSIGGKLGTSKNGLPVDVAYRQLVEMYPEYFSEDIWNETDQFLRMAEVAGMDLYKYETYPLDDEVIQEAVNIVLNEVRGYKQNLTRIAAEETAREALDSIAPSKATQIVTGTEADARLVNDLDHFPVKTVKERLAVKLQNIEMEIADNEQLKREAILNYNQEIARLTEEYVAKKDKNTKVANNIIRRIVRIETLKANVEADYSKRISDLEARQSKLNEEIRTGESQSEQGAMRKDLHQSIIEGIKAKFTTEGFDFDEVLRGAKDLSTFSTVDNTPQRVMEKALGYKEGQALADITVNKVAQNETEGIKWLNSYTDRKSGLLAQISKQYDIKPGSKESAAAQMYAEGFYVNENNDIVAYGDAELAQDFPNESVRNNIKGLAKDPRIRQIYDETLDAINESRARNAYPEIQKLDNYFLHFRAMDDTFSKIGLPFNPNDIKAKDLPTDLNGVTADLKPGQPYFSSALHRRGKRTSFDLLGGLERYLTSAKNQIYHIDDIQTLRALRNYIADTYGQANGLEGIDALTEEEAQEKIEQVYNSHLSTFAKFLNEEANVIAGKTALIDRGLEGVIGRRGMTFMDSVRKQVGSNMIGFNVSSSLTNFLAGVQAIAKSSKAACVKALAQTTASRMGSIFGKKNSFVENNPTIIRRKGAERFYRTPFQKVGDAGYVLMSAVDDITTEFIVRAKYNEFVKKGMSEQQAITEADKWTSRLMGDRSLGQMPQIFNSKTLSLVTQFQLEVRNQLDSQFYDTIQEAKASNEDIQNGLARNAKTAAKVTKTFFELAVLQHLFGKGFEAVAGYNPAFDIIGVLATALGLDDDEDSEDTTSDNIAQSFLELLEDLPYTSAFIMLAL